MRISKEKKKIIESNERKIIIKAGPGSGKTTLLVAKILHVLELNEDNKKILVLTYTNAAANEMKVKIKDNLDDHSILNRLFIGTFHSFCRIFLNHYGYLIGISPGYSLVTQPEIDDFINDFIENQDDDFLKSNKQSIKNKELFKQLNEMMKIKPNIDFRKNKVLSNRYSEIFNNFIKYMQEFNILTFSALVYLTKLLLKENEFIRNYLSELYSNLFIDEFQDSAPEHLEIIKLVFKPTYEGRIFIVGDPDQLIYAWTGVKPTNLNDFAKYFGIKDEELTKNYRCPDIINEISKVLISKNTQKPIIQSFDTKKIDCVNLKANFIDYKEEIQFIYNDILDKHKDNLDNVVVLARNKYIIKSAINSLSNKTIPIRLIEDKYKFNSSLLNILLYFLKLINSENRFYVRPLVESMKLIGYQLDSLTVYDIAKTDNLSYPNAVIEALKDIVSNDDIFLNKLIKIFNTFQNETENYYKTILSYLKLIENCDKEDKDVIVDDVKIWMKLHREIKLGYNGVVSLKLYIQEVDQSQKIIDDGKDKILFDTIHSSKGKEFDHVYIMAMVEKQFPDSRNLQGKKLREERNSCYVAITRARKTLTISLAKKYKYFNSTKRYEPSIFLNDMGIM